MSKLTDRIQALIDNDRSDGIEGRAVLLRSILADVRELEKAADYFEESAIVAQGQVTDAIRAAKREAYEHAYCVVVSATHHKALARLRDTIDAIDEEESES